MRESADESRDRSSWSQFDLTKKVSAEVRSRGRAVFDDVIKDIASANTLEEIADSLDRSGAFFESLGASPGPINALPENEMLDVALESSKIPELQSKVSSNAIGEIVYHFSYDANPETFRNWLMNASVADQVDRLLFSTALMRNARAQGAWTNPFVQNILSTFELLNGTISHPLTRIAFEHAKVRIQSEMDDPSGSVIQYTGDRSNGREVLSHSRKQLDESEEIALRIRPAEHSYHESRFQVISRDVVASLDQSQIAQSFAHYRAGDLWDREPVERKVRVAREWADALNGYQEQGHSELVPNDYYSVMAGLNTCFQKDPEVYAKLFPGFSENEWAEVFASSDRLNAHRVKLGEFQGAMMQRAEQENAVNAGRECLL